MIKPIRYVREAVLVWLLSYIFFMLSLANNFSASHDSINYLLHITRGDHLFHQHHLLYHYLANKWLLLFSAIAGNDSQHYIIESFTAVWGSLNLAVCYLFFRNRFNLTRAMSVAGIAAIAFSYGTWFYSVNIEVYAPPVFFILCALYVMSKKEVEKGDVVSIALLQSAAILFHQFNILFTVVVLYWLLTKGREVGLMKALAKYAGIGILVCGAVYFYAGWVVEKQNTPELFANWLLGYTKGHSYWQPLSINTPLHVGTGFFRAFIGSHFVFELPPLKNALQDSFSGHALTDEIFLVRNVGGTVAWILTALAGLFAALFLVLVARFARKYGSMNLHYHVVNPLLVTIVVYSLFFCFWMPEILEFWILQMILLWLLIVGMLPLCRFPLRISSTGGVWFLAALLLVVNFFGSVRWLKDFDNDWYYVEVKKLDDTLDKQDLVIVGDEWLLKDYVRYYSRATVISEDDPGFSRSNTEDRVKAALAADHKVYVHKKDGEGNRWVLIQSY